MHNLPPGILEELEALCTPLSSRLPAPTWLFSNPDDLIWRMKFGKQRTTIDWRICIGDVPLTSDAGRDILEFFKSHLLIQTHAQVTSRGAVGSLYSFQKVARAARQLDYLILNDNSIGLSKHGPGILSENDLHRFMYSIELSESDDIGVYDWAKKLSFFMNSLVDDMNADTYRKVLRACPLIRTIDTPQEDRALPASEKKLIRWRAALMAAGLYVRGTSDGYKFVPDTTAIAKRIYKETLWGCSYKPIYDDLCIGLAEPYRREKAAVPVRTAEGVRSSKARLWAHMRALRGMLKLDKIVPKLPLASILTFCDSFSPFEPGKLKAEGRFRTLPFWQVMDGINNATNFVYEHGEHLIDSFLAVSSAAKDAEVSPAQLCFRKDIREYLAGSTIEMGVTDWSVIDRFRVLRTKGDATHNSDCSPAAKFRAIRLNRGLVELVRVLWGAMIHIVGRQAELLELRVNGCLDDTRSWLVFKNGKSGAMDIRETEMRPVPPVVSHVVALIARLHDGLRAIGKLSTGARLFSIPGARVCLSTGTTQFNSALDIFCDYFATPLDKAGRRFYARQHQFRRFFALAFFYAARCKSLDVLRWFLGHTDAEHLFHYLTSSISGEELAEVESWFLADTLRDDSGELGNVDLLEQTRTRLVELVQRDFGTSDFRLIDEGVLGDYLKMLLKKGLTVEPRFIRIKGITTYSIVIHIKNGCLL